MRLGILADIHEGAPRLALALQRFRQEGVQQVVVLGDVVFEMGGRLHETIALLAEAGAVGDDSEFVAKRAKAPKAPKGKKRGD